MIKLDGEPVGTEKIESRPPRIYTNTPVNLQRSVDRLARWVLKPGVTDSEVKKGRAAASILRLRVEIERLELERMKWEKDCEILDEIGAIKRRLEGSGI